MKLKILPLAVLMIAGCGEPVIEDTPIEVEVKELDYSITENHQIIWNDILSKSESRYMVYFYSEYCAYCKQVKQDILSFYSKNIDDLYFLDVVKEKATYKSNDGLLIGTKKIDDFYIFGTPFLVEITNFTVTNWYAGVDAIQLYISTRIDNKK